MAFRIIAVVSSLFLIGFSPSPPPIFTAAAQVRDIELQSIRQTLVPMTLLQGDREFGGNGPDIYISTTIELSEDRRQIVANVFFRATETKADWSKTAERFLVPVYTAPAGSRISRIVGETRSVAEFTSKPANFQILAPTEDVVGILDFVGLLVMETGLGDVTIPDGLPCQTVTQCRDVLNRGLFFINNGNHVHVVRPDGGPVASYFVVGDTGGDDISDDRNGHDDTRIVAVGFRGATVEFEPDTGSVRRFEEPGIFGLRLDWCRDWGGNCGEPAAQAFCEFAGFARATEFAKADNVGASTPTSPIRDDRTCSADHCDGFAFITCAR